MSAPTALTSSQTAVPGVSRVKMTLSAWLPVLAALAILILMLIAGQIFFGDFITPRLISALFDNNPYLIVLAIGMTFVILTGGIDLSVGAVIAFSGLLGAQLFAAGWPAVVVLPLMVLSGTLIGVVIGVMVSVFDIQPFIASLAGMSWRADSPTSRA